MSSYSILTKAAAALAFPLGGGRGARGAGALLLLHLPLPRQHNLLGQHLDGGRNLIKHQCQCLIDLNQLIIELSD